MSFSILSSDFFFYYEEMKYKGLQFPMVIKSPYAVAQVLNQEIGKLKAKDLRESKYSQLHFPSLQSCFVFFHFQFVFRLI